MPSGLSIHVGIDFVDKEYYGATMSLPYCKQDAMEMQTIAASKGFDTHILLDQVATAFNFSNALEYAASVLEAGDILFISYSGHGGQQKDDNGDEDDEMDETLVLFDREIRDDRLLEIWTHFAEGVRILFVCDSCHSGTITKAPTGSYRKSWFGCGLIRLAEKLTTTLGRTSQPWDRRNSSIGKLEKIKATVLLLAACKDTEVSGGCGVEKELSLFTEVLSDCWADGCFNSSYHDFYKEICRRMSRLNRSQNPGYLVIGKPHPFFEYQIPFTI